MKTNLLFSGLLAAGVLLTSCEDALQEVTIQDQAISADGTSTAAYQAINIDLVRVDVSTSTKQNTSNWKTLAGVQPGLRDLLTSGTTASPLFTSTAFPTSTIRQVRLILGKKNTIKLNNGRVVALAAPSSGLKVKVNTPVITGQQYALLVSANPCLQVSYDPCSHSYSLNPVLTGTLVLSWGGDTEARTSRNADQLGGAQ